MSQVSTGELRPTSPAAGGSSIPAPGELIDRLPTGQLVRAEVIRLLSDNLLTLAFPGGTLQAKTSLEVAPGDRLTLEVQRDSAGLSSLRLIEKQGPPASEGPRPTASPLSPGLAETIRPGGAIEQLVRQRPDLAPRVEQLLQGGTNRPPSLGEGITQLRGEVSRLVEQIPASVGPPRLDLARSVDRLASQLFGDETLAKGPDLAARLLTSAVSLARGWEATLRQTTSPTPPGNPPPAVVPQAPAAQAVAPQAPGGSTSPVPIGPSPESPASEAPPANSSPVPRSAPTSPTVPGDAPPPSGLLTRAGEGVLLRAIGDLARPIPAELPASTPATPTSFPASPSAPAPAPLPPANLASPSPDVPTSPNPRVEASAPSSPSAPADAPSSAKELPLPTTVRGVLESDLKGQLLELRGRLEAVANTSPSPALSASIARTDRLVDQLTTQQLRNVDGLHQYFSVSLPVDPKTGVGQAELQAFYRKSPSGGVPSLDESSRFTVALFLQLSKLGDVMATVTGVDGSVSIAITADDADAADRLRRSLEELRTGLSDVGQAGAMITVRERPRPTLDDTPRAPAGEGDLWEDFIEPTLPADRAGSRLNREA